MKFVLGTANIGQVYGIANSNVYNQNQSLEILSTALNNGINAFDTAANYGEAESMLGGLIGPNPDYEITTKISLNAEDTIESFISRLNESLRKLCRQSITNLLFHNMDAIHHPKFDYICRYIIDTGKIKRIGLSVYSLRDMEEALEMSKHLTKFQIPENILDRRLIHNKKLIELSKIGYEFDVRSVFLQGLLLMQAEKLPEKFRHLRRNLVELDRISMDCGVSRVDLCLSYIDSIPWKRNVVIAAASSAQLLQLVNFKKTHWNWQSILPAGETVRDPRLWDKL